MVTTPEEQPRSDEPNPVGCNKYRRCLLVLFAFSLFATTLGLGIYSHLQKESQLKSAAPPCLSPACLKASEHFSVAMDPFSHPCDYFLFACGAGGSSTNKERQRIKGSSNEDNGELNKKREVRTGGLVRMRREADVQGKSDGWLNKFPDRQTALLKAIKEILEAIRWAPWTGARWTFVNTCGSSESNQRRTHTIQVGHWVSTLYGAHKEILATRTPFKLEPGKYSR
ncbi:hypothetical protein PO909_009055, partial [Leuciscus waleckii]